MADQNKPWVQLSSADLHVEVNPLGAQLSILRDRSGRLTYRQLVDLVDSFAADLAGRGVRPGQRVSVWLPSSSQTAVALLACSRNGYVCCPSLHREHTIAEVSALLERTRSAVLLAQPGYGADAERHDIFSAARTMPSRSGGRRSWWRLLGPSVHGPSAKDRRIVIRSAADAKGKR